MAPRVVVLAVLVWCLAGQGGRCALRTLGGQAAKAGHCIAYALQRCALPATMRHLHLVQKQTGMQAPPALAVQALCSWLAVTAGRARVVLAGSHVLLPPTTMTNAARARGAELEQQRLWLNARWALGLHLLWHDPCM